MKRPLAAHALLRAASRLILDARVSAGVPARQAEARATEHGPGANLLVPQRYDRRNPRRPKRREECSRHGDEH
jgi:hypothetical protein